VDELIARARRARWLLNEPEFQAACEDVERSLLRQIADTAWDEQGKRERCHAELRALRRVQEELQGWADELTKRNID